MVFALFHRNWKKVGLLACAVFLLQSIGAGFFAAPVHAAEPVVLADLDAESAILIEASTGKVLFAKNADEAKPPASMAKMMTEYITLESISSGLIKWEDPVTVSKLASRIPGSGQLLAEGEQYTVEDMFKALSIYSSNDAAVVLAERIGGTVDKFADLMNQTGKRLGLSEHALFVDPTGLERSDLLEADFVPATPGETLLSAKDCAIIAKHIVNDHPEALEFTGTPQAYLKPGNDNYLMVNWNYMLGAWKEFNNNFSDIAYEGLDGLKTGFTDNAGYCFTGTAERNGFRLISVVMHTKSKTRRFSETRKVLDYGFDHFEKKIVMTAKREIEELSKVDITKGVRTEVPLVTEKGLELVVRKDMKPEDVIITAVAAPKEQRVAPIKTGDALGSITLEYKDPGGVIGQTETIHLVASEDVEKAGWFRLLMRGISKFFGELFSGIKNIF